MAHGGSTRLSTNCALQGVRELCCGGHEHKRLSGHASKCSWTRLAQEYPRAFCLRLAGQLVVRAGLRLQARPLPARYRHLNLAECAKAGACERLQILVLPVAGLWTGEPWSRTCRMSLCLDAAPAQQERAWRTFEAWLREVLSELAYTRLCSCPALMAQALKSYGRKLFSEGAPLQQFRQTLVAAQRRVELLKPCLTGAWQLPAGRRSSPRSTEFQFQTLFLRPWLRWLGSGAGVAGQRLPCSASTE